MDSLICFANGQFIPKSSLSLSIDDLGFSRGCTLFEHLKTFEGCFFHPKEHLYRLFASAKFFQFNFNYTLSEMLAILEEVKKLNGFSETGCKIYLTAGSSSNLGENPSLYVVPYEIKERPLFRKEGVSLQTTSAQRTFKEHKTTFYMPGLFAFSKLKHEGVSCYDVLYMDEERNLLESTTASFSVFIKDTLHVPEKNILPSITQEILIRLAKNHFAIQKGPIPYETLSHFSEAFLAASIAEILPVQKIDSYVLPKENPRTCFLKELFDAYIKEKNWPPLEAFEESYFSTSCL